MDSLRGFSSTLHALLAEGAEIVVGGCRIEGRPCICRALTAEAEDERHLLVVLSRSEGAEVLEAVSDTRLVTVRVSARDSLRSVQLQGNDARILKGAALGRALLRSRAKVSRALRAVSAPDVTCLRTRYGARELATIRFRVTGSASRDAGRRADPPGAPAFTDGSPCESIPEHARRLLDGGAPLLMCVVSADGMPHLLRFASVVCIDERHVAVSLAGERAAREGLLSSGSAALCLFDPDNGSALRMHATLLRTELSGPVFERLRAREAAVAWLSGVADERCRDGVNILEVQAERRALRGESPSDPQALRASLSGVRRLSESLSACDRLTDLVDTTLAGLAHRLDMACSILWLLETRRQCLVLLASHGYPESGIGAELPLGQGVAGIAADAAVPVRIARAMRPATDPDARTPVRALDPQSRQAVARPGLGSPGSQLAVPLLVQGQVVGTLFVEGGQGRHFDADDEDALTVIAAQLAVSLAMLRANAAPENGAVSDEAVPSSGKPIEVRFHRHDSSVYLDGRYLIRGVAGALFWKLVSAYLRCGIREFSTRELRHCTTELRLPEVRDNLYSRLLLLQRRLRERGAPVAIERTGRGRFRLSVNGSLQLADEQIHAA